VHHAGPRIFTVYANSDFDVVRQVRIGLSKEGLRSAVWLNRQHIAPGANWNRKIERDLDSANLIVFFISPRLMQAAHAQQELQITLHRQIIGGRGAALVPILLERADVPPLLKQVEWIDMTDSDIDRGSNNWSISFAAVIVG
jgi:hypothetical protein